MDSPPTKNFLPLNFGNPERSILKALVSSWKVGHKLREAMQEAAVQYGGPPRVGGGGKGLQDLGQKGVRVGKS